MPARALPGWRARLAPSPIGSALALVLTEARAIRRMLYPGEGLLEVDFWSMGNRRRRDRTSVGAGLQLISIIAPAARD